MTVVLERTRTDLGHQLGSPAYARIVAALFAAGMATFVTIYSTQALLPELVAAFGVSTGQSTLALSVTTLGLGAGLLVAGPLSERVGRTRLVHVSLFAAAIVAIGCAFAPTWSALLVLRLIEGFVLAGLPAVATAYLREELHPDTHARVAGLYIGGTALGGMTGRLLTGPIGEFAGWRWALLAAAAVALVCAIVVRLVLPASRRFVPRPVRFSGLAGLARAALADRALIALYAVGACGAGAVVAVYNALGFRLAVAPFHLGLAAASLVFLVYPVGSISSAVAGRLADRFGRRVVLPFGSLLGVVGVLLTLSATLPLIIAGVALLTAGFFALHGVASGWVPARAYAGGVATSLAASFYLVGFYLGSSVFGSLAGRAWSGFGWPGVVILAATLLIISGGLAWLLRQTPALSTSPAVPSSR